MHKTQVLFAAVLFFSAAAFSLDVHSEYSHIYSDTEGSSHLWNFSVNDILRDEAKNVSISYDFNCDTLKSTHSQINGELQNASFFSSVTTSHFSLGGGLGVFNSSKIKTDFGNKISNDGFDGMYFGFESLFNIFQLQIKPFYYYSSCDFLDGDMAYFMGHPSDFIAKLYGSDLIYKKNQLQIIYLPLSFDILTNDSKELLFTSKNFLTGALYSRELSVYAGEVQFNFNPFAAYYFAQGNFNGILTRESQPYFYFVFNYYKANADYNIHSILLGSNSNLVYKSLKINFDSVVIFIPHENMEINTSWKKLDKLPKWQEKLIWNSLEMEKEGSRPLSYNQLEKSGLVIFNLGADYSFFKNHGEINLEKKIIIPFSFNKPTKENESSNDVSENQSGKDYIKNILLSGISLGGTLRF